MLKVERTSLIQFVSLFVVLIISFLLTFSVLYYYYQKNIFFEVRQTSILYYAGKVYEKIYSASSLEEVSQRLVKDSRFDIALLNDKKEIVYSSAPVFNNIPFKKGIFEFKHHLYEIESIEMAKLHHYRYIVIRTYSIERELTQTRRTIYIALFSSIIFMTLVIYALSKLFLRPLREYIGKLDGFIRDTTHELNTPLSIITMSVERLNEDIDDPKLQKHLNRMTVALRTISHLYNDLTFLTLYQQESKNENLVELHTLLEERIHYFRPLADTKKIIFSLNITPKRLMLNPEKISRVIDNLLSNAIKYNKRSGSITITLNNDYLRISDTGIGIPEEKLSDIFLRYTRFDDANGGFGIGLNIVYIICQEYGFPISVHSKIGEGTTFEITF
ncbi:MAG: HAMP domain-containing sensor histidine kinase [Sulfuricurvum sp.]|nr:HAMP domain-containing sensor histidine kinase [Sulfuricurvum sp.]